MEREKYEADRKSDERGLFTVRNFIPGLENIIKIKNKQSLIIILIIIGIALMLFPGTGDKIQDTQTEEAKIRKILTDIDGAGNVSVVITYYADDKNTKNCAKGAVVTADGADNIAVKNDISEAVQAALDLPAHKVKVYKSKK